MFVEIPSVQIDDVHGDTTLTASTIVANRWPEPGEVQVPRNQVVYFTVTALSGSALPLTSITVNVNGVPAYSGGAFQSGFTGSTTALDTSTYRFGVDQTALYESAELVGFEVITSTGAYAWAFVTLDTTQPELADVVPQDRRTLRAVFNEPMGDSALVPGNYKVERVSAVAAQVVPVSVTRASAFEVDIHADIPLTFGAQYKLTVTDTKDIYGNVVAAAPDNQITFSAFNPEVPAGRRFQLWDFIPEKNKREDQGRDLYRFVLVLQELSNLYLHEIDRMADFIDPDVAPEPFIDAMLLDLGNPFSFDLSLVDKRRLLGVLMDIYALKGTAPGVIYVIQFLMGITVTISLTGDQGWELGVDELGYDSVLGAGGSFMLYAFDVVSPVSLTVEQENKMRTLIDYMQVPHAHLVRIVQPEDLLVETIDHVELGISELGVNWELH